MMGYNDEHQKEVFVTDTEKWSIMRYRSYDDFMYGSFDVYVTKEEIVIRGHLKRGQPSLYMKLKNRG